MRYGLLIAASVALLGLLPGAADAAGKSNRAAAAKARAAPVAKGRSAAPKTPPTSSSSATKGAGANDGDGQAIRRGERVEFDARLIQGQTAKAGAVYLFERVSSDLSSMVQERRSYRREIVEEVFPRETDR